MPLPIVLVHGAWSDSGVWRKVARLLEAEGHAVATPDMPGCGTNERVLSDITLDSYVEAIEKAVASLPGPVLLVGHSIAGVWVSQAAERISQRLAGLVYVSAFMLRSGESRYSVADLDPQSMALKQREQLDGDLLTFSPEAFAKIFGSGLTPRKASALAARIPPQPVAPLKTPLRLTEGAYGRVPRYYIKCTKDLAVTPAFQDLMIRATSVRRVFELPAGHNPALSHPRELAAHLEAICLELESL